MSPEPQWSPKARNDILKVIGELVDTITFVHILFCDITGKTIENGPTQETRPGEKVTVTVENYPFVSITKFVYYNNETEILTIEFPRIHPGMEITQFTPTSADLNFG